MFRNAITALQFLTIFTLKKDHRVEENELARSVVYFPFVGFLLGIIQVYADRILLVLFPDSVSNVFLILIAVVLTRALHLDGLADTFDGVMGGMDPKARLAIMKDSRIGTAGVLAVALLILAKYACLNSLFNDYKAGALLTAPVFGRWSQILMMFKANYGREQGMGKAFVGHLRSGGLLAASTVSVGISAWVIMDGVRTVYLALLIPLAVAIFTLFWRWFIVRKFGGVTGDAVGAASEMTEALTLLLFVVILTGGTLT